MEGWKTRKFSNPNGSSQKRNGRRRGRLASSFEVGVRCHFIGYSIIFMIVKVSHYGLVIHRPFRRFLCFCRLFLECDFDEERHTTQPNKIHEKEEDEKINFRFNRD